MATRAIDLGGAAALPVSSHPAAALPEMTAFDRIPHGYGVAILSGEVVVYDDDLSRVGLKEGAFYVVEYQRPRGGMTAQLFKHHQCDRLETSREVVRIERMASDASLWIIRHHRSAWVSGPLNDCNLADMIVGRVVGLFRPRKGTDA